MSRKALSWIRAAWVVATVALIFAWREEAVGLFVHEGIDVCMNQVNGR